jgi:hypothetical protein
MDESRRRIIKAGAVGAGLVWAAPALKTVRPGQQGNGSPGPSTSTTTTTTPTCAPCLAAPAPGICNGTAQRCGDNPNCREASTTEGDCFCAYTGAPVTQLCSSSSECGPGQRCMTVCFPGNCTESYCIDECPGISLAPRRSGLKAGERQPDGVLAV